MGAKECLNFIIHNLHMPANLSAVFLDPTSAEAVLAANASELHLGSYYLTAITAFLFFYLRLPHKTTV